MQWRSHWSVIFNYFHINFRQICFRSDDDATKIGAFIRSASHNFALDNCLVHMDEPNKPAIYLWFYRSSYGLVACKLRATPPCRNLDYISNVCERYYDFLPDLIVLLIPLSDSGCPAWSCCCCCVRQFPVTIRFTPASWETPAAPWETPPASWETQAAPW